MTYQKQNNNFRNLTYDLTMTLLLKTMEKFEPDKLYIIRKAMMIAFQKLSKILAYSGRFLPDLSLMILKSRDHGCQFWKILKFA